MARAISLIEDEAPQGAELVRRIFPSTGRAYLIGITGSPGARERARWSIASSASCAGQAAASG